MDWREHIVIDKDVLLGKPVIKGTRISIEHLLSLLVQGWTEQQILENYPRLTHQSMLAVFAYLQHHLQNPNDTGKPLKSG